MLQQEDMFIMEKEKILYVPSGSIMRIYGCWRLGCNDGIRAYWMHHNVYEINIARDRSELCVFIFVRADVAPGKIFKSTNI